MDEYTKALIEFDVKDVVKRKKNILSDLDDFEELESSSLPSGFLERKKQEKDAKKEQKKVEKEEKAKEEDDDDDWIATLTSFDTPVTRKKTKNLFDGAGYKKKKKKKKAGESVDYKKEFEPEMILLRNLQYEQDKFVASLQKKYDQMESTKSTARGVGKFTTDLMDSITTARSLSRQLVNDIISTKKNIAELDFKERKEFGSKLDGQNDAASYASNFLKQMMGTSRNGAYSGDASDIDDSGDMDELFDSISESLGDTDRGEDVEKYLQYENENPVIKVVYHEDNEDDDDLDTLYDFVAISKNGKGDIIPDYPLPTKTRLQVNKSTGKCKDKYGNQYDIIFA